MQYGQTNGIPQGSVLSDFISEIILGYADKELFTKIANISDYRILRYRDDYRIFSNSKENAELILKELTLVLAELNFHINPAKTILSENIVENAIKKDKFYYISNIPILQKDNTKDEENEISMISNIKDELYYILAFSKQFPNSPSLVKMMLNVAKRLAKVENVNRPVVLIAIITEILVGNPKVYQQAIASLSLLIDQISEIDERTNLINQIYKKLSVLPNIGHIQVWLQRIADIDYSEPLCKIAKGEPVQIWNFEWLKDEFHKGLPLAMIVDIEKKNSMQPIIGIEEIDVFGY